ncbi:HAD family hydrolase [Sulfitobacter aestuariivivens]|uniref:HAD family phosphatase n=1 Tax=Sulfitobacter aestuariivivens TaxID=2766981 RepID=A0A927D9S6_9RHOB|nr:HAD family phosphatase [Sulfitobacter aestuariivivens]MBD3666287.1 HAD family phosphatase [Sulfitobacter aestuariivivens]
MQPVNYVLFDCDGVLVDSEPITNRLIRDELASYGLHMRLDQVIDMFVGGTMKGVMTRAREMGAALPDDWLDQIYARMFQALGEGCTVIPGVPEMLDRLDAAGIGYAVGSNGPMAKMEVTLGRCDLWQRFEGRVFSAHDCAEPKPAPDVYLKAAAAAGVDPADCVVIEDSASGARAGKAAGMRCFGYVAQTPPDRLRGICDQLFTDMANLPALLRRVA